MRPVVGTAPYEPPRLRNQRMRDLRTIAAAYAGAIASNLVLLALIATSPSWLFEGTAILSMLRGLFVLAVYVGSGALVMALTLHRIASWSRGLSGGVGSARWATFFLWPVLIGTLLFRIASARA